MDTEKQLERLYKIIEKQQKQIDDLVSKVLTHPTVVKEYFPMPSYPLEPFIPFQPGIPIKPGWSDGDNVTATDRTEIIC